MLLGCKMSLSMRITQNSILYELEKLFAVSNSTLSKHHFPQPNKLMMDILKKRSLKEVLSYDIESLKQKHSLLIDHLNKEQKHVYDNVVETMRTSLAFFFFAWSRWNMQNFLWTTIITRIISHYQIVLAMTSFGVAFFLLPGGRTTHSRLKKKKILLTL